MATTRTERRKHQARKRRWEAESAALKEQRARDRKPFDHLGYQWLLADEAAREQGIDPNPIPTPENQRLPRRHYRW